MQALRVKNLQAKGLGLTEKIHLVIAYLGITVINSTLFHLLVVPNLNPRADE